ncbi:MAG: cohesin domain-containing protein [Anaerolineae bacterium]
MLTRLRAIVVALFLLTGLLSGELRPAHAEALTIRLQPTYAIADVGDTVLIKILVDGAVDLGAFEFHLGYDPSMLEATGAELGAFLTSTGRTPVPLGPVVRGGEIRFAAASYGAAAGPDSDGVLAEVGFRVLGEGTSGLTFNRLIVTDTYAQVLPASAIDGTFTGGASPYPSIYVPLVLK